MVSILQQLGFELVYFIDCLLIFYLFAQLSGYAWRIHHLAIWATGGVYWMYMKITDWAHVQPGENFLLNVTLIFALSWWLTRIRWTGWIISAFALTVILQIADLIGGMTILYNYPEFDWRHVEQYPIAHFLGTLIIVCVKAIFFTLAVRYNIRVYRKSRSDRATIKSNWTFILAGGLILNCGAIITMIIVNKIPLEHPWLFFGVVTLAHVLAAITLITSHLVGELREQNLRQAVQFDQIATIYQAMRMERHDFINHLQTLFGFIQTRSLDHADQYIRELVQDIKSIQPLSVADRSELGALLQVKSAVAARENIAFELEQSDLLQSLAVRGTDLNVIIGNIINNAIEALQSNPQEKGRMIRLSCERVNEQSIQIQIVNNGPVIPSEVFSTIRQQGVTTKSGHSGIGLYSVQSLVSKYGGDLQIASNSSEGTVFTILLPAKPPEISTDSVLTKGA